MSFENVPEQVEFELPHAVKYSFDGDFVTTKSVVLEAPKASLRKQLSKASSALGGIMRRLSEQAKGQDDEPQESSDEKRGELTAKDVSTMLMLGGGDDLEKMDDAVVQILFRCCKLDGRQPLTSTILDDMSATSFEALRSEYVRAFLMSSLLG